MYVCIGACIYARENISKRKKEKMKKTIKFLFFFELFFFFLAFFFHATSTRLLVFHLNVLYNNLCVEAKEKDIYTRYLLLDSVSPFFLATFTTNITVHTHTKWYQQSTAQIVLWNMNRKITKSSFSWFHPPVNTYFLIRLNVRSNLDTHIKEFTVFFYLGLQGWVLNFHIQL